MEAYQRLDKIGGEPTEDDLFYVEFGGELVKRALPFVNEVLRHLATLSTALAGGSAAFLSDAMIGPWLKLPAVVVFVLSLAVAFLGIMPYHSEIRRICPDDVRGYVRRALRWKMACLYVSATLILVGLVAILVGLAIPK